MFRKVLSYFALPLLLLLSNSSGDSASRGHGAVSALGGLNPGPDIITGDIADLEQYGNDGTQVGLGVSTTSCNAGNVPVDFFVLPSTDHPIIPHNLYRMSGGASDADRFEQIGQSWVKHTFGADQLNECGFGCIPANFTHLGAGCSDTYASFQNAEQQDLGSRAWVNPFTGVFQSTANDHTGHVHTETSHRILVNVSDLNENLNLGATYYCEVQYISPHEYAWCQTHPGECNMYNNSSYRQFRVSGSTQFFFSEFAPTVRMTPAVHAWTGATINPIEPDPGVDGRAFIAYKVTGPVAGFYHYEYAIYNENLDRGIQSFSFPLGCGIMLGNAGFHAPPNHPGFANDGTQGDAGFSNVPWTLAQDAGAATWSTETFAQNQNANAIRWGTLYNFRFDSNHPPVATNATIGFFKTGTPVTVAIAGPDGCATPAPTPTATPTATASPSVTPSATPTVTPATQAINLSTRMRVQTGDNIGIGGFIVTGTGPKRVLVRALGPSLGVPAVLADPILELHGPVGFPTIINDNWRDGGCDCVFDTCLHPPDDLESWICETLNPGAYTALVRGKNNTSGTALVEVYDGSPSTSKLANLSTRAFVTTGSDIVIAGFILGGSGGNDRIVARGIGPSLTGLGIPNALANPTLELRDSNGALLVANNDWQDDPAQAAELTAAGLALTNQLESGIAATLPPGPYTALLAGLNNGTGVGLVEVYDRGAP
jgi:hypothetical protein